VDKAALPHALGLLNKCCDIVDSLFVWVENNIALGISPIERQVLDAVGAEVVGYLSRRAVNYMRDVVEHNCVDVLHSPRLVPSKPARPLYKARRRSCSHRRPPRTAGPCFKFNDYKR